MGWVSRLPIRLKAPVTVALLVLVVGAAISAAAHIVLRRTLHEHAAGRLLTLQAQYRESYRQGNRSSRARIAEAARRPELAAYLREPVTRLEARTRAAMPPPGPAPEWVVRIELRDVSGRILLAERGPAGRDDARFATLDDANGLPLLALAPSADSPIGYGRLVQDADSVLFPIVARIGEPASGFLVVWRRVATSWQASQQVATVLGGEATTYMINADGTLWTESGRAAAAGPGLPVFDRVTEYERAGRGEVLSVAGAMDGTPWAFIFEFPVAVVQAPAGTFLRAIVWVSSICIFLGIFVAWGLSRRLTAPLHELSRAADSLASGNLSTRARVVRADELGRLVKSFNFMAAEVEAARDRLESLVEERTARLRTAEESLVRREKLSWVGQFASGIGHEIRNPLAVMGNAIHLLDSTLTDKTPEVRKYVETLRRQVELSTKIVNDLLDLSRASPPRRESVTVASFVGQTLEKCVPGDVVIDVDIPGDLPAVEVDPLHAAQVIDNLLTNALQALNGRGSVQLKARHLDDAVCVEISDTGPGVSAGNEARIFEPLFTTKRRGIGLGLALSKSLAQANGGDLTLASRAGEGARFVFTLPVTHLSGADRRLKGAGAEGRDSDAVRLMVTSTGA